MRNKIFCYISLLCFNFSQWLNVVAPCLSTLFQKDTAQSILFVAVRPFNNCDVPHLSISTARLIKIMMENRWELLPDQITQPALVPHQSKSWPHHCIYLHKHPVKLVSNFWFQTSKHYELLNYSEHGTTVDNVLYSCDFSDKPATTPQPSAVVAAVRHLNKTHKPKMKADERLTLTARPLDVSRVRPMFTTPWCQ